MAHGLPVGQHRRSSRLQIIQNAARGNFGAKLYFDSESGLLVRQVRYVDTAVGVIPMQIDYSDYRPIAGVKVPFRRVLTWTDGRSTIDLSQVQPNVRVGAAQFAKPAAPELKPRPRRNLDRQGRVGVQDRGIPITPVL